MAFNISNTLDVLLSHVAASGHVSSNSMGEPIEPPSGDKLHGSVYMRSTTVQILYGDGGTQELHVAVARLYRPVMREPTDQGERELAIATSELMQDFAQDFTLGGTVREIDLAGGQGGEAMGAEWGHVVIKDLMYRVVDITVPIVIDDSAAAAA